MREYGSQVEAHLAGTANVVPRHLVWIVARNRGTGAAEAVGFWNGKDSREFDVGGETRSYFGAGALLSVGPIRGAVGLDVRRHELGLSAVTPEVLLAIRGYDVRLAPIEVHRAFMDPETGMQIGAPVRVLKGTVDEAPIVSAAGADQPSVTLVVASASRALTRTLTAKKSEATQRQIDPSDRGREYSAISGAVGVFWGVLFKRGAPPPTPRAPLTEQEKRERAK